MRRTRAAAAMPAPIARPYPDRESAQRALSVSRPRATRGPLARASRGPGNPVAPGASRDLLTGAQVHSRREQVADARADRDRVGPGQRVDLEAVVGRLGAGHRRLRHEAADEDAVALAGDADAVVAGGAVLGPRVGCAVAGAVGSAEVDGGRGEVGR